MRRTALGLALTVWAHAAFAQSGLPMPGAPPADAVARRDWLRGRLDELFAVPALNGAKLSVMVSEPDSGKVVYGRSEKTGLNAASNVKIVTSAASLAMLGPEYRWKTAVYGPARASGRVLDPGGDLPGDLYLRGSGDPTMATRDLVELATELTAQGLRRIRGSLVVDATFFDNVSVGPAFDQKDDSAPYRAPSSAMSLNNNTVAITISPAAVPGGPAKVVVDPPSPYFIITGQVVTARRGPASPLIETIDGGNGTTRVLVAGRVRLGADPRTYVRRVVHPELFVGYTFREILRKRGVVVDRPIRLEPLPASGFRALATHDSPPLAVVMQELNKRSINFAAEQVIRTLGAEVIGRPGSWEKGVEATSRYLDSVGIPRQSYRMVNGSGLYDSNRFSAEQITQVLRAAMRDFRIAGEFLASLSVAGADGTLAQRMAGTIAERYVRAKTGTLANVSCLSGVAGAPGQKPLVFSILMNDVGSPFEARAIQDRAVEIIVSYLEPPRPLPVAPSGAAPPKDPPRVP
jgi:D-alanyl-D-alanine carboxypeptidase/D-alanyl-D-alanine-endopeptidase (penicillin-binding protein 4)